MVQKLNEAEHNLFTLQGPLILYLLTKNNVSKLLLNPLEPVTGSLVLPIKIFFVSEYDHDTMIAQREKRIGR